MYGDGCLEIGPGRSHTHSHRKPLHHLVRARADAVEPDDALLGTDHHELERGLHLILWIVERIQHRPELRLLHHHVRGAELLPCRGLCEADGANRRVREYDGGDELVRDARAGLAAEKPIGEPPPRCDSDGRELVAGGGRVADGTDAGRARIFEGIHLDQTFPVHFNPCLLQLQRRGDRAASYRHQNAIEASKRRLDAARAVCDAHCYQTILGLREPLRRRLRMQRGAVRLHRFHKGGNDVRIVCVLLPEYSVATEEEVRLCAEAMQDARHFNSDVASSEDRCFLGLLLEVEEAVA
mmetsp:Transcript_64743/g.180151  ORF Transcript_64743/g.180151 Transcript_64743/m.180151 type:complete len:296 (-) Transcript_64743:269-1156(-)